MPKVEFVGNDFGPDVTADAPEGGALADLCDRHFAPVPFSCRSASCGTCRIEVLEGLDLLEPMADDERAVLEEFDDPPGRRLACQAVVRAADGVLRVRAVED